MRGIRIPLLFAIAFLALVPSAEAGVRHRHKHHRSSRNALAHVYLYRGESIDAAIHRAGFPKGYRHEFLVYNDLLNRDTAHLKIGRRGMRLAYVKAWRHRRPSKREARLSALIAQHKEEFARGDVTLNANGLLVLPAAAVESYPGAAAEEARLRIQSERRRLEERCSGDMTATTDANLAPCRAAGLVAAETRPLPADALRSVPDQVIIIHSKRPVPVPPVRNKAAVGMEISLGIMLFGSVPLYRILSKRGLRARSLQLP